MSWGVFVNCSIKVIQKFNPFSSICSHWWNRVRPGYVQRVSGVTINMYTFHTYTLCDWYRFYLYLNLCKHTVTRRFGKWAIDTHSLKHRGMFTWSDSQLNIRAQFLKRPMPPHISQNFGRWLQYQNSLYQ